MNALNHSQQARGQCNAFNPATRRDPITSLGTYSDAARPPLMSEESIQLYHAIAPLLPDRQGHAIEFLGSCDNEGTSTVASEFSRVVHAVFGKSVLVLDADPFKLSQHDYFNLSPGLSWSDVSRTGKHVEDTLYPIADSKFCISLLSSYGAANRIAPDFIAKSVAYLKHKFDYIIIDSPPPTTNSIGIEFCASVDGVILVMAAEVTRWPVTHMIKQKIAREGGNLLGIVFNQRCHYLPSFIYRHL